MVSVTRKAEQINSGRKTATRNSATIFVKSWNNENGYGNSETGA